ncbi:MAG: hypothetical protein IPI04_17440 [Ignavibacteria bacterium]|nr:hypothetical protein [Ignavibacteria bacterium]
MPLSTTIVPTLIPLIILFLLGKFTLSGFAPSGNSEMTAPHSMTSGYNLLFS